MTLTEIGENIINFKKERSTIDLSRTESSTKNETKVVVHRQTGKIADYIEIDYNDLGKPFLIKNHFNYFIYSYFIFYHRNL